MGNRDKDNEDEISHKEDDGLARERGRRKREIKREARMTKKHHQNSI